MFFIVWIQCLILFWCLRLSSKNWITPPPGGWGRVLNKCLYWEAPPPGPTPYPFLYHFSRKRYPFSTPSIDKWYSFHTPCLKLCIPFNCCKFTVFQISITKLERFLNSLIKQHISFVSPFEPFHRTRWHISLPFYIFQLVISLPSQQQQQQDKLYLRDYNYVVTVLQKL